jgi:hypothetical protein
MFQTFVSFVIFVVSDIGLSIPLPGAKSEGPDYNQPVG